MAVETFVYMYIAAFGVTVLVAATLLVAAARQIGRQDSESHQRVRQPRRQEGMLSDQMGDEQRTA